MSASVLSPGAQGDGATQTSVPRGSVRRYHRGRASHRRAALHRASLELQQTQQIMDHAGVRQRFEQFRSTVRGDQIDPDNPNNSNLRSLIGDLSDLHSVRTDDLHTSQQQALHARYKLFHVPRIGHIPSPRPHGVFRWMYCQVNGLASAQRRAAKLHDTGEIAEKYDVDGIAFVEVGVNWSKFPSSHRLASWFEPHAERQIRSTESFNIHGPTVTATQQGGTAMLLRHGILEYSKHTSHDSRGLGRWSSWVFQSNPDHSTRVVTAYCPGRSKNKGLRTVYSQQLTKINRLGLDTSPYSLFVNDLLAALRCWRSAGDRIILFIDSNEHILLGPLARKLTHASIRLVEISHSFWPRGTEPNTYFRGSQPIDGIYVSPDIEATSLLSLSFHEGVGDHRTTIVDFTTASMIGHYQGHVVRPTSRRLTTKQPSSVHNYNTSLLSLLVSHRVPERLQAVMDDNLHGTPEGSTHAQAETLFEEIRQLRIGSEHTCRRILKPHSPFSLPIKYWYDRIHTFRNLIRLREGLHPGMGKSRILRAARRLHIPDASNLSIDDCKEGIRLALLQQREVRKNDVLHRSNHLRNCLQAALDKADEERAQAVRNRMRNERDRSMWRRINRVTRPIHSRSCMQVQVHTNGLTTTYDNKEDIERVIQHECAYRFHLGHSAPISRSLLGEQLDYFRNPEVAEQILDGSYPIPDDTDPATALMLIEMGTIGRTLRAFGGHSTITVSTQEYQHYFSRINENTSSSPSGLHLGHDKAAALCDDLSDIFTLQMNTILQTGIHPARWAVALQITLEKLAGVCLVDKLRSIQLYEADYNWFNKFIFNDGALRALESAGALPEEQFSHKGSTAEDACFDKTLTVDISRQSRIPMALILVNAAQCYDRVNHTMMSLVWLALQVPIKAISIILSCLQYMKIFTRTGWGDSNTYFGGPDQAVPFSGLGQGSKAAPASWIQLSSIIVNVYKSLGFGATVVDPVNATQSHTVGCLYVDDTDLYCMDESLTTIPQVAATASRQISWWSRLLNATGGAIKPEKSFWYLLAYRCIDGVWSYEDTMESVDVPLPDGTLIQLTSKPAGHVEKTLGVLTAPGGGHAAQLASLATKATTWSNRILNGHLPASFVWKSYHHQLRPQLCYALGTLSNDVTSAQQCFRDLEFHLLPQLGVNRSIRSGWRRIHHTFGGIGMIDLSVEQFICRINMFTQHYGTPSSLGHKLSASVHWLQLQLGCLRSPFLQPYSTWAHIATPCWVKCFWETLFKYDVDLRVTYAELPLQREGDTSIMSFLLPHMHTPSDIASVNRCRCHLNMIFLSDMVTLDGRSVQTDMIWGSKPVLRSKLRFPPEFPTQRDWSVWARVWAAGIGFDSSLPRPLGRWLRPPHFIWPWKYNATLRELYILGPQGYSVYRSHSSSRLTRHSQLLHRTSEVVDNPTGTAVSVSCTTPHVHCSYPVPHQSNNAWGPDLGSTTIMDFWDQIREWGGLWMWEMIFPDLGLGFDVSWMISALRLGSLVAVTDGSYDRKKCPCVCAAGWIIMDITTGSRLAGSFSEYSTSASSYRGELLGLCAVNIILLALAKSGNIDNRPSIVIWCDNTGAVNRASENSRRIKCGRPCADILRVLRSIRQELPLSATFRHVKSHMDDSLTWEQLTLEQQLNCNCDMLAKSSVHRAIENLRDVSSSITHPLPKEAVALYVDNHKVTSDPTNVLRYRLSKSNAREFLTAERGWTVEQFNDVGWDWLHQTLAGKPVMFRLWLSKQHSDFCATGVQMRRRKDTDDDRCPSCHSRRERAKHLCICPSESRTSLFLDNVSDLERWMANNDNTDPELAYWLAKYILGRGKISFGTLGNLSPNLRRAAESQDTIGWRNLMEGRVTRYFHTIQCLHLSQSTSRLTGDDWMRGLISRLLHISHSQWLFRNFTLHDSQCGYKRLKDKVAIQHQITELRQTDPSRIPAHSKFLLEIDLDTTDTTDFEAQVYWVAAMEAARNARAVALLNTTRTRPTMSTFGEFTVREAIRKEVGEMFGRRSMQNDHVTARHPDTSGRSILGIDDSDRRRKPD